MSPTIFDESYSRRVIHPAIDIIDGVLYVGIVMPYEVEETGKIIDILHLITSNGECFPAFDEELQKRGLKLRFQDAYPERRWDLNDIKTYIENTFTGVSGVSGGVSGHRSNPNSIAASMVLDKMKQLAEEHIYFYEEETYDLICLWAIGTYLQPIWDSYPYLSISGLRRSGKTTLMKFLETVCFNAMLSPSISAPALFRTIQATSPTLLIDEAEKLASVDRATELRDLLLQGYKRTGYVIRIEKIKDKLVPRRFNVFSPKAIVSLAGLEEYLEDRSIPIVMIRTTDPEITNKTIRLDEPKWVGMRNLCYRFAFEYFSDIQQIYATLRIPSITARDYELWKPILTLAEFFGIYDKIYRLAMAIVKEKETEDLLESRDSRLLEALVDLVTEDRFYSVTEIRQSLEEYYDEKPKWLNNWWIGRTLTRRLKFKDKRKSTRKGIFEYRLRPDKVRKLAAIYGVLYPKNPPETPETPEAPALFMPQILEWLRKNRDGENSVVTTSLTEYLRNIGLEPQATVAQLLEKGILQPHPTDVNRMMVNLNDLAGAR